MINKLHKVNWRKFVTSVNINKLDCSQVMCKENLITVWHLLGREKFKQVSLGYIAILILVQHVKSNFMKFKHMLFETYNYKSTLL
jgi:hypothetical protein